MTVGAPPSDGRPRVVIALACQPRSGSSLVARALTAGGHSGRCDEMLNVQLLFGLPRQHGHRALWLRLVMSRWVHRLLARRVKYRTKVSRTLILRYLDLYTGWAVSDDGVLAVKQFWHLYAQNMLEHGLDMGHWGAPVTWVRLVRSDRLAQAVSHVRAEQNQQWTLHHQRRGADVFDEYRITEMLHWIEENERGWDDYFASTGAPHLLIDYRELDEEYESTVRRIFDHVGFGGRPVPPPQLERQRDAVTDEWIERYRSLHPEYAD